VSSELTLPPLRPADNATQTDKLWNATLGWILAQDSPHTRIAYQRDLLGVGASGKPARMKAPAWIPWCRTHGLEPLAARRRHVDLYARELEACGQGDATRGRKLSAISSWYAYLISEELADYNPAKDAKRPRVDRDVSPAVGLSEDEMNRFLDRAEADSAQAGALVGLLYFSALRVSSVLNADMCDLGWDQGARTLRLRRKGGITERVVIEQEAARLLEAYLAANIALDENEPLFTTRSGHRLDEPYVWRLIRRTARAAGIESWAQIGPHSLRHSHITHALDEGVPIQVVQDTARHKDTRTTLRYDRARQRRGNRSGTALSDRRQRARGDER